jgi:hypothetical protein
MRLTRGLIVLAITAIIMPSFMTTSTAATKAGTPCSKVGNISIASGKKFTCIKVGKKLIWNNGVAQKTTNKPTPQPSKSPTILIYPTSSEILKIDRLVESAFANAKPAQATIDFQVGPGVESAEIAAIAKASLPSALVVASAMNIELTTPLTIYIGNRDWLAPKMPAGTWCSDPMMGVPGPASAGFCGISTGVVFLSVDGYLEIDGKKITRNFSTIEDRHLVSMSFTHELIHVMQGEAAFKYAQTKGNYNPYWLSEGGANVGALMAQAHLHKIPYSQARVFIASYSSCIFNSKQAMLKDYIVSSGQNNVCGAYYDGFHWSEYLVASSNNLASLIDLPKQNERVGNELVWDPNKQAEFNLNKLALSLKYGYSINFEEFTTNAYSYAERSTAQLLQWLNAKKSIYPPAK